MNIQIFSSLSVSLCVNDKRELLIRGGTVQLTHGSVCITVLESRFRYGSVCAMFREKLYWSNKNKENKIYLTTSNSTNNYNRVKIQIK